MCAGGAAEHSANSVQQIWILCHMTAPKGPVNLVSGKKKKPQKKKKKSKEKNDY